MCSSDLGSSTAADWIGWSLSCDPDLSWLDELQSLKAEADAAIKALTLSAQPETGLSEPSAF